MPQLPISAVVSAPQGAVVTSSASSGLEAGEAMGDAPGLSFGALLTNQLKGVYAQLGLREKPDLAAATDGAELAVDPAAMAGAATTPNDFATIMLLPATVVPVGGNRPDSSDILAEGSVHDDPAVRGDTTRLAAEIAGSGKGLPVEGDVRKNGAGLDVALSGADLTVFSEARKGHSKTGLPADQVAVSAHPFMMAEAAAMSASKQEVRMPSSQVAPAVGSAEWGGALGDRVLWMANQNHQVAELHLNPPNLGPLEVRLTISNDQASAQFVSTHSAVREAIETALPRLREMLADNGIMLGNATVGSELLGQQAFERQGGGDGRQAGRGGAEGGDAAVLINNSRPSGLMRDGMVDIFA